MYDYIKELFDLEQESQRTTFTPAEEYQALNQSLAQYCDEISFAMGKPFFNGLRDACLEHTAISAQAHFRQGFRVAVSLMLGGVQNV